MKLKFLMVILVTSFSLSSRAGLLVEPYFGVGSYATTADITEAEQDATSFTSLGGRLGYSFLLFSAGIDYGIDQQDGGTRSNTSLFAGVDMPILVRAYAKYIVNSKIDDDDLDDSGIDDIGFDSGFALGVGFTGLPFVVINLEIENSKYVYETNSSTGLGDIDVDYASYLLTVSIPFDL